MRYRIVYFLLFLTFPFVLKGFGAKRPNIVLILADDMGWSPMTWAGLLFPLK